MVMCCVIEPDLCRVFILTFVHAMRRQTRCCMYVFVVCYRCTNLAPDYSSMEATGRQQVTIPPYLTPPHRSPFPPLPSLLISCLNNQVQAMEEEFERQGVTVEVVRYGGEALHAFTRPEKTDQADRDAGLSYCKHADEDSWRRVVALLREELKQ